METPSRGASRLRQPVTKVLAVRVSEEMKVAIEAAAAADNRSISQWLANAAKAAVKLHAAAPKQ